LILIYTKHEEAVRGRRRQAGAPKRGGVMGKIIELLAIRLIRPFTISNVTREPLRPMIEPLTMKTQPKEEYQVKSLPISNAAQWLPSMK
jgi:hypothetical protein